MHRARKLALGVVIAATVVAVAGGIAASAGGGTDDTAAEEPRRPLAPAVWAVDVQTGAGMVHRALDVAAHGGRLRVLATGDSMIQTVDAYLAQELGKRTVVTSEPHISTGLSSPDVFDWVTHAADQAATIEPHVTVVYLGANDGFPVQSPSGQLAQCCGERWVAEYARRVETMMRSYARDGASLVYWLTLPAPRDGHFLQVYGPVNEAVRRAAARVPGATVVAIDELLAPGYRFRDTIDYEGRTVDVRQDDGIHLSPEGAAIVADEVATAMRR